MKRFNSIDFVRGVVMIIMALDHVRDMMHTQSVIQNPVDLNTTTPMVFFTRLITHLCAPVFVFLAGTSAYISATNKNNFSVSANQLIIRGFWLIFLEFTVVNFAIFFDIGFHTLLFEVIAAIGFGFIILGLLLKLPSHLIGLAGLIIIFCHALIPLIPIAENSLLKSIITLLFNPTAIPLSSDRVFVMGYPPVPWLGIMLAGFGAGKFFYKEEQRRRKIFIRLGLSALFLFIAIRFINIYGDSIPWSEQKNSLYTFLSFINISKYPPSLLFSLITLGIMFLLLAFSHKVNAKIQKIIIVYGRVPLFYFIVHFYLIHIITIIMLLLQNVQWSELTFVSGTFGRPVGKESGLELWAIYLIWILVVLVLYKPCKWFGRYKAKHTNWWLKYI